MDTIFALSTGRPPAGLAIVRVSGPDARMAARTVAGRVPTDRRAVLAHFVDAGGGQIDHGVMLFFPGPGSATGEDCLEFHCHGGRAVVDALLARLGALPGLRPAIAGEFTRRAFANGRIDLNEADGLADLLAAETQSQRRAALAMAEGGFSARVAGWEADLLRLSAMAEAALDFSDEDDVADDGIGTRLAAGIAVLVANVRAELDRPVAERLRDGVRVVIAGPPNAGKSTLLNALVGREAAIVSDIAGTTRDRIDVPCAIGGYPFLLTDTAGLRDGSDDAIERIGIDRARDAMRLADIILWLGAAADTPDGAVRIAAQCDRNTGRDGADIRLSAITGEGMDMLHDLLREKASSFVSSDGYALNARQRAAVAALVMVLEQTNHSDGLIVAEQLRLARLEIDALTGRSGTEDMLDSLFGRFCIGK